MWRFIFADTPKTLYIRVGVSLLLGVALLLWGRNLGASTASLTQNAGLVIQEVGRLFGIFAVFTLLSDYAQRRQLIEESAEELSSAFREVVFRDMPGLTSCGLKAVKQSMDFKALFDSLDDGDELIWYDTFAPGHDTWSSALKQALERGVKVRIVMLSPDSALAPMRQAEVDVSYSTSYAQKLSEFQRDIMFTRDEARKEDFVGEMRVFAFDGLLGCPCYIVRQNNVPVKAFSSLYLKRATGRGFYHFEWGSDVPNSIIHDLNEYVEYKLSASKELQ